MRTTLANGGSLVLREKRAKKKKKKKKRMAEVEEGEISNITVVADTDDDDEWTRSVIERMEGSRNHKQKGKELPTIFRVPPILRSGDPNAYEPMMVSIGPYHHGNLDLRIMEELKWQFLDEHVSATQGGGTVSEYLKMMKDLEAQTRRCYSEEIIKLESKEFVEMMLLDSCFLVQILLPWKLRRGKPERKMKHTMLFDYILIHDLLLFENQLPFFVVQCLFDALHIPNYDGFKKDILTYLGGVVPGDVESLPPQDRDLHIPNIHHLLHLFHLWYFKTPKQRDDVACYCCSNLLDQAKKIKNPLMLLPVQRQNLDSTACCCCSATVNQVKKVMDRLRKPPAQDLHHPSVPPDKFIPTATELVEAGVKLKATRAETFLDVTFNTGVLGIPTVHIDDWTNSIFRNLLAFEQCCPQFGSVVTAYTVFMDSIINSPSDAALLQQSGIIDNGLADHKEVANLFNRIGKNINYEAEKDYLAHVAIRANKYCESIWPSWRAKLVHDYFSNPWAIISFGAATALLGLTITQTVYSIYSYNKS